MSDGYNEGIPEEIDSLNDVHQTTYFRNERKKSNKWVKVVLISLGVAIVLAAVGYGIYSLVKPKPKPVPEICPIFCNSDVLHTVQVMEIYNSSKTFVDLPMLSDPDDILKKWEEMKSSVGIQQLDEAGNVHLTRSQVREFLLANFGNATTIRENDLEPWVPPDVKETPKRLTEIKDPTYAKMALSVNRLWEQLGVKPKPAVYEHPLRHSLIGTKHPFIVPGGRFREIYYWDTYWVIRGLLVCDMKSTARHMVENLLDLVDRFGFVPNGNRRYYLNRSQPPFLTQMVQVIYDDLLGKRTSRVQHLHETDEEIAKPIENHGAHHKNDVRDIEHEEDAKQRRKNKEHEHRKHPKSTQSRHPDDDLNPDAQPRDNPERTRPEIDNSDRDNNKPVTKEDQAIEWLRTTVPLLDKEYEYWMRVGGHAIRVPTEAGNFTFNRYWVDIHYPRPESYREDLLTARVARSEEDRIRMYSDLAAGAESGWDYSSRWFADRRLLRTIDTRAVLPVDLNAVMCRNERSLMHMHRTLNNTDKAEFYRKAYEERKAGLKALFWEEALQQWIDIRVDEKRNGSTGVLSNFFVLWSGCWHDDMNQTEVMRAFNNSGLNLPGGLATTSYLFFDEQQWDYPNAWAPAVDMIIEGFESFGTPEGHQLALSIAQTWVATNYLAWQPQAHMFEKYDARKLGQAGGGGEYEVQIGFGWTNGVFFSLLDQYPDELRFDKERMRPDLLIWDEETQQVIHREDKGTTRSPEEEKRATKEKVHEQQDTKPLSELPPGSRPAPLGDTVLTHLSLRDIVQDELAKEASRHSQNVRSQQLNAGDNTAADESSSTTRTAALEKLTPNCRSCDPCP